MRVRRGEGLGPLPRGWPDAVRQLALLIGAYVLYQVVRGLVVGRGTPERAIADATRVIDLERRLHVFVEPSVQRWALHVHWLAAPATWVYLNANIAITGGVLLWIYLRRHDSFRGVRDAFLVAMAIALVGYAVFPTAPPRLMPQWGFVDVVARVTGVDAQRSTASDFINLYAAIPSMHVCFSLLTAGAMVRVTRRRVLALAWVLYPPLVAFVVIITGNHYLTDVVLGAVTAGLSALAARRLLARARPRAWSPAPSRADGASPAGAG